MKGLIFALLFVLTAGTGQAEVAPIAEITGRIELLDSQSAAFVVERIRPFSSRGRRREHQEKEMRFSCPSRGGSVEDLTLIQSGDRIPLEWEELNPGGVLPNRFSEMSFSFYVEGWERRCGPYSSPLFVTFAMPERPRAQTLIVRSRKRGWFVQFFGLDREDELAATSEVFSVRISWDTAYYESARVELVIEPQDYPRQGLEAQRKTERRRRRKD